MTLADQGSFGSRLRQLREAAGLSQEELAERAGLSSHAVSALERGTRTRPYPHTVRALGRRARRVGGGARRADRGGPGPAVAPAPAGDAAPAAGRDLPVPPTTLLGRDDEVARVGRAGARAPAGHADRHRAASARPGSPWPSPPACGTGTPTGSRTSSWRRCSTRPRCCRRSRTPSTAAPDGRRPTPDRRARRPAPRPAAPARAGQRRAPDRGGARHRGPDRGRARADRARHQPGAAAGPRRDRGRGRAAGACPTASGARRASPAVRLLLERAGSVSPGWGQPTGGRRGGGRDLRPAGRHPARPRAGRGPRPGCSTRSPCSTGSTWRCSTAAGTYPSGSARCARPSTGATACSTGEEQAAAAAAVRLRGRLPARRPRAGGGPRGRRSGRTTSAASWRRWPSSRWS